MGGPARILEGSATGRTARAAVLALTALIAAMAAIFYGATMWTGYRDAIDAAMRSTANLAVILDEHAQRTVRVVEVTLDGLADLIGRVQVAGEADAERIRAVLSQRKARTGELLNLFFIDASGKSVADALGIRGNTDLSDRPYFIQHRDQASQAVLISEPAVSVNGLGRFVVMTRRLSAADGRFAGVIGASVAADYLQSFYRTIDVGPNGAIILRMRSGAIVARQPASEPVLSGEASADPHVAEAVAAGQRAGTIDYVSSDDGIRRITSFRAVAGSPLIVSVGRGRDDALAEWRTELMGYGLGTLAFIAAAAAFSWYLLRQMAGREAADAAKRATERAAEAAVRRSEAEERRTRERLQTILERMPFGCALADAEFRTTYWNPSAERIFGYRFEEVKMRDLAELIVPDMHMPTLEARRARLRAGDMTVINNTPHLTKDKRKIICESHNTPLFGPDGSFQGIIAMYQDVTERLNTEDALRQSSKMDAIGQLTGGVAHDFNNLLTVIIGNAESIEDPAAKMAEMKQLAATVRTAGERGAALTHRLLAFARRQPLDPTLVDLNALVRGMETIIRRTIGEDIDVELALARDVMPAFVDASQVESAILNLAVNSRHAMAEGGRLTIETGNAELDEDYARRESEVEPGRYVMLAVTDTGQGMSEEVARRAFEPFFTTKGPGRGSGLGLSQVYGFAKQSKGHVKIYSELGHGTTAKLYLPQAAALRPAEASPDDAAQRRGGGETILVVEDDDMVRRYVVVQLKNLGYDVLEAGDGPDALTLLGRTEKIDLLFTDVILPKGLRGPDLAARVRQLRPSIRVLYTSGYTENAIIHQGRLDPGVHLLTKPFRKGDLARKIRDVLDETVSP